MNIRDIFKSSFLENIAGISMVDMVIALFLAFLLGLFIFYVYKKSCSSIMYSASFGITLIALALITTVLVMTVVGSYFSQYLPNQEMGLFTILCSAAMGVRFLVSPAGEPSDRFLRRSAGRRTVLSLLSGGAIGFYCGFMGVGGGLMMLFLLTFLLGYERRIAVGTSVFVMTFTALTGSAAHFLFGNVGDYVVPMALCMVFTLLWSLISARWANRLSPRAGGRVTGMVLLLLGVFMLAEELGLFPGV